ncbi:MAG: DUF760 domain-containing protein [Mastigocoleus sp.]
MKNNFNRNSESLSNESTEANSLWDYVQSMSPETVTKLSQPASKEVLQTIERTVVGMLGSLPGENFSVSITTNRDSLGRLLASAIMNGYFLRNVEQRMAFEDALESVEDDGSDAE